MTFASGSSQSTGPMLPGFETFETYTEPARVLWPTPQVGGQGGRHEWAKQGKGGRDLTSEVMADALNPPISSAGASPASPSPTPASAEETPTNDGFGRSSYESYARLSPDGSWLRMYQDSFQSMLDGSLEECSGTWPRAGTMRNGTSYRRLMSERPTSASGSSSWPTPRSHEAGDYQYDGGNRDRKRPTLTGAAKMWPTPNVPSGGRTLPEGTTRTGMTPDGKKRQVDLNQAVKRWPTPSVDTSGGGHTGLAGGQGNRLKLYEMLGYEAGKLMASQSLNPYWVEWLMGLPLGWTELPDLKDSATPSSPPSQSTSGG